MEDTDAHKPIRPDWAARPPAPPKTDAPTTVAYTVRFDTTEAAAIDAMVLVLRVEAGRKTLDRSEVVRALLRMAGEDSAVRALLVRKLTAD